MLSNRIYGFVVSAGALPMEPTIKFYDSDEFPRVIISRSWIR